MASERFLAIKTSLASSPENLSQEDIRWLVERVEQLESENEFLKKELRYLDYQGEIDL
ncbi:MAG: hypothetical protein ACUVXF_02135 [Desulfobaccales bacterium]